jgi:hypothetical protein
LVGGDEGGGEVVFVDDEDGELGEIWGWGFRWLYFVSVIVMLYFRDVCLLH